MSGPGSMGGMGGPQQQQQQQGMIPTNDPALNSAIQKISQKLKTSKSSEERQTVFNDLKKSPALFSAFLKMKGVEVWKRILKLIISTKKENVTKLAKNFVISSLPSESGISMLFSGSAVHWWTRRSGWRPDGYAAAGRRQPAHGWTGQPTTRQPTANGLLRKWTPPHAAGTAADARAPTATRTVHDSAAATAAMG